MPRKKSNRRGPGSPILRDSSSSTLGPRLMSSGHGAYDKGTTVQPEVEAVKLQQLQEIFNDSITPEVVQLLYMDNNRKVEPTLDALIAIADPVRPSLVSPIKEDAMEFPEDANSFLPDRRNNLSAFENSANATVGNKPVGFERSKIMNDGPVNARVNVPALFSSLPHSDYHDGGIRHDRLESVDGVPLLTPVDFPGFNYPSVDMAHPLLPSPLEASQIRQPVEEVIEPSEQFNSLTRQLTSNPINIPQIPHMDSYHIEKQPSLSPKSPKNEQNLSRSPKSAPRSPKGQPKSPHQAKPDSKPTGKSKKGSFEKYQVPPRLKKKAKSHDQSSSCIDRLQPEQHAERRRKSLPATLYNPMLTAVKEQANYFPAVDCKDFSFDVPDKVTVIPEEDEDNVAISTEVADMDVLLSEIHSTTNTNDEEEEDDDDDSEPKKPAARRTLSVEGHKNSNFGKSFDEEKVEKSVAFNGMQDEALLKEARMSLSQPLNVGAKEFVPRTTTPEPKVDSDSLVGDYPNIERPECQKPLMNPARISKTARQANPYMMPSAGGIAAGGMAADRGTVRMNKPSFQQPNGHEGKFMIVSVPTAVPYVLFQPVPVRQTPSPEHFLPSNATPPNSLIGSPATVRRQASGQGKKKKRKKGKNKFSKESEAKGQSSKESIDDNNSLSDKIPMADNTTKIAPMREEPLIPQPVNTNQLPVWPKIKTTNYKPFNKDSTSLDETEPLPDGKVLCLMRGLPGCGKTTLARKLQGEGVIYSTDDYFINRNREYVFRSENLTQAHEWNRKRVLEALENGINPVIVDNTNIEKWAMRPYIDLAKKLCYEVVIREPDTPWKLNPNQLSKRCTHGVSKEKIALLLDNYDPNMTVQKVMGTLVDRKKTTDNKCMDSTPKDSGTENAVELDDNTRTITVKNKLNIELGKYEQTSSNECFQTKDNELKSGSKLEQDASKSVAQEVHMHRETAQQHLQNVRKLGNVASPNISTGSSASLESSEEFQSSLDLAQTCQKHERGQLSDPFMDNDNSTHRYWSDLTRKRSSEVRQVDRRPERNQVRDSETSKSGINSRRRIHSLIKGDKVEISDDDEVDANLHGDVFDVETNKILKEKSELASNHSEAAVNVDAKDFALLQRIESGVQSIETIKNETVLIGIGSNFIPSDWHATEAAIPLVATLDKGSMTLENKTDDNRDELLVFFSCFPSVPKEDLLHVLQQCNNDTQWASEILLDSNMYQPTNSPSQQRPPDSQCDMKEPPKEPPTALGDLTEPSALNPLPIPSSTAPDLKVAPCTSQDIEERTRDRSDLEMATGLGVNRSKRQEFTSMDDFILQLDAKFGSQLQERFGHYGSYVDLGLVSREDLQVAVPSDLASKIYDAWLETLKKKHLAENRAANMGKIKADEDLAKKLQQEEDYLHMKELQEAKLSSLEKHRPWMISGHTYRTDMLQMMPDGRACYQPALSPSSQWDEVDLREIMDQELHLQLVNDIELEHSTDEPSIAAKIKREMLFKRFPKIDKDILENVFSANLYHLGNTIRNVESSYNLHPMPIHTVLSDKARDELEKRLVLQADEDNLKSASDMSQQPTDSIEELDMEYPDDADYVDFRADAILHRKLQMECFQKASEAHRKGQKQLATHYADKGRMHKQKLKEANQEASKKINQKMNKDYLRSNILDLHYLHVDEAVDVLQDALNSKKQELKTMQLKPKTLYLSVITGRGKNSPLEVARIRQAVRDYLEKNNYQFSESTPGLIKVSLKPDC